MLAMPGKSVRLFLVDGAPQGLRTAQVGNWSGLAVVCPRTDLAKLGARADAKRTGVYILVGPSENAPSGLAVYVGESDDVWDRVSSHDAKKDFWTWVTVFVSKDDNMTKAHVRWLESTLVREVKRAGRAEVMNTNDPPSGRLPEADTADMEVFLGNIRLLLPTLGVNVFAIEPETTRPAAINEPTFELRWEDARATCVIRDGQFVVQVGSTARVIEVDSLTSGPRALRQSLRTSGVLVPDLDNATRLRFAKEYAFDSPSMAAAAVAGTGLNGRATWKLSGTTTSYGEWEERQVGSGE